MTDQFDPDDLFGGPPDAVLLACRPDTVTAWKAVTDGLLTTRCCAFHRNMEISLRYAWIYRSLPTCLKWAGMAAFASHHIRFALLPLRVHADRTGYVDIPHSRRRRGFLLADDVDTIRATNNAIFDDIFWAHLAYVGVDGGIGRLRALLDPIAEYAPVLAGFEAIDAGRRVLEDPTASAAARRRAEDRVWAGNVQLLEHEQRNLVQPRFNHLSCLSARLVSMGAVTSFEVRGVRREIAYLTSFYVSSFNPPFARALRTEGWPRITRYDDRWRWLVMGVVPRFRRLDANATLVQSSLARIIDEACVYLSKPCVLPHPTEETDRRRRGRRRTP
jgi:hypothetical protein